MKRLIRGLIPPLAVEIYRAIRGSGIRFRGEYQDWAAAERHAEGYDAGQILEKVRLATHRVVRGEVACERDSVVFADAQYPLPLIAILLRAALEKSGTLNVLDFGGALGSSYYQCRDFLGSVSALKWCVVEQPNFVECGRREFQNDILSFLDTVEAAARAVPPSVILASGVLQYMPKPIQVLESFVRTGADYIVIDRTPFSMSGSQVISVQSVPSAINRSSYPLWLFDEARLQAPLLGSYRQIAAFDAVDGLLGAGRLRAAFKGLVFRRIATGTES